MSDFLERLEKELLRAGYDRSLRARVRRSPARPVLATALAGVLVVAALVGGSALLGGTAAGPDLEKPAQPVPQKGPDVSVVPRRGGKRTRFTVTFTAPRATGDLGRTRRSYVLEVHRAEPRAGCIQHREAIATPAVAGARASAQLDPAQGHGAGLGWCPGRFRGTVTYSESYRCPARGRCKPPRGFQRHTELIGRFAFRVR